MENPENTPSNVPDIDHAESERAHYERMTQEAHRIAERLMAEHFGPEQKKEPARE